MPDRAQRVVMGKPVSFTDEELAELEAIMDGHGSSDAAADAVIKSAYWKIGAALGRPWAVSAGTEKTSLL